MNIRLFGSDELSLDEAEKTATLFKKKTLPDMQVYLDELAYKRRLYIREQFLRYVENILGYFSERGRQFFKLIIYVPNSPLPAEPDHHKIFLLEFLEQLYLNGSIVNPDSDEFEAYVPQKKVNFFCASGTPLDTDSFLMQFNKVLNIFDLHITHEVANDDYIFRLSTK